VCTRVVVKVDGMVGQNGTSHLRLLAAVIIVASETIVKRGNF